MTDRPTLTETWTPCYIRRTDETLAAFVERLRGERSLPFLIEEPKPSTGRPVGRPRKAAEEQRP